MTPDDIARLRRLDAGARGVVSTALTDLRDRAAGEALGALLDALAAAEAEAEHLRPYALLTMARSGRLVVPEPIPDTPT